MHCPSMFSSTRSFCRLAPFLGAIALAAAFAKPAHAQNWPDKPVRMVVAYAPGGTTDLVARLVAEKLTQQTGKPFYVENKAGASGTIGASQVAKSAPDGGMFLVNDPSYAMVPSLFARLPWDPATDLIPVTTIATTPVVLVVNAASPFKTVRDVLAFAQANPDKLNFGSGGNGSSTHLSGEVLKKEAHITMTHVPYKGAGEAMAALLGKQVDLLVTAAPTAIPQVNGGRIRALAVTGDKRLSSLPNVPTFKESGLPGYTVSNWFGVMAPKGTPPGIVSMMRTQVVTSLADPKVKEQLNAMGASAGGAMPQAFGEQLRSETRAWGDVIKAAGVKAD